MTTITAITSQESIAPEAAQAGPGKKIVLAVLFGVAIVLGLLLWLLVGTGKTQSTAPPHTGVATHVQHLGASDVSQTAIASCTAPGVNYC
jgi:hypothetical protein